MPVALAVASILPLWAASCAIKYCLSTLATASFLASVRGREMDRASELLSQSLKKLEEG